jgi:hypothetical protein
VSPRVAPALVASLTGLALGLSGCDSIRSVFRADGGGDNRTAANIEAQTESGDSTPARGERDVEFPVVAESVANSLFPGDGAAFASATVPVLAPSAMSREQASTFVSSFRATPDGYFAQLGQENFDVVVNGTRVFAVAPESAGARPPDAAPYRFSESDTGVNVSFNRFGADYSIDFVCRGAGGAEANECITEAQAAEFVDRLVPVGGGGR